MKKKLKFMIPMLLGLVVLGVVLIKFGITNDHVHQLTGKKADSVRYVLVNEDLGADYNGKKLTLGDNFVNLINQDKKHSWQVAPLNVAEAGYKNGTYDVEIVLPQNFSQRLLNLQSTNPQKAQITYKVRQGSNEKTNQEVEKKIGLILNSFNQKIIKMYFSSVIANLSNAQRNVNGIVNGEQQSHNALTGGVQTPFKQLPGSFGNIVSSAQGLDEQSQSQQGQKDSFTNNIQQLLASTGQNVDQHSQNLVTYLADEKNNSELNNTDSAIADAANPDFNTLEPDGSTSGSTSTGTDGKDSENQTPSDITSILSGMDQIGATFSKDQTDRLDNLSTQVIKLTATEQQLRQLRLDIQNQYFDGKEPQDATEQDIKNSLQLSLNSGAGAGALPQSYLDKIKSEISKNEITTSFPALVNALTKNGLLSTEKQAELLTDYKIVEYYARYDLATPLSNNDTFKYLSASNGVNKNAINESPTTTFSIPTNADATIELTSTKSITVNNAATIASTINSKIAQYGGQASASNGVISISFDQNNSSNNGTQTIPSEVAVTVKPSLSWTFDANDKKDDYRQAQYSWTYTPTGGAASVQNEGSLSCYVDTSATANALQSDLPDIVGNVSDVSAIASEITTLFSAPGTKTNQEFSTTLTGKAAPIRNLADTNSIYKQYGSFNASQVSDDFIQQYKKNGTDIWNSLTDRINEIGPVITSTDGTSLQGTIATMKDTPELLNDQKEKLQNWYDSAMKSISDSNAEYQKDGNLLSNGKATDTTKDSKEQNLDSGSVSSMLSEFEQINSIVKDAANGTASSANAVSNLTGQFKALVKATQATNDSADKILKNTNSLASTMGQNTNENRQYANTFGNVLSNTHNGGADNQNVFDFLSNPLKQKGEYTDVAQETSPIPYFMTVLVGLTASIIAFIFERRLKANNRRSVVMYMILTDVILAGVMGGLTFGKSGALSMPGWIGYLMMIETIISLVVFFLWDKLPAIAPYIYGFVIGMYLMLTPILGFSIQNNTLLEDFYKFSPFQNVENGFSQLIHGGLTGIQTGLTSLLLVLLLILSYFLTRPKAIITDKDEKESHQNEA